MKAQPPHVPRASLSSGKLPRSRRVLLLVDYINPMDFPTAADLAPGALRAARATARLKAALARERVPAIYANDNYGSWHSEFSQVLARCSALPGAPGEIARLLAPAARDLTLLKPRHSAFHGTPLDILLAQTGAQELVIAGLATDLCVQLTAADAFLRGFRIWVPRDCAAAESPARHRQAMEWMARALNCSIRLSTSRRLRVAFEVR